MTIRRGQAWGTFGPLPEGAPIVSTDRSLASLFDVIETDDGLGLDGPGHVGLCRDGAAAGATDLARTVSARSSADDLHRADHPLLPLDLAIVALDDARVVMAASLVVRRPWWRGTTHAVMNASFLGEWNVAPSGHPNDGRLDVIVADLGFSDRLKARSRLASGTHLPHPNISMRRLKHTSFEPEAGAAVWIDGHPYRPTTSIAVTVIPDATTIVI